MAKIRMLAEDVIGKIAAGEVVERPASAIKELVENSLDAGARSITVDIQEGGIESFRVTDDGCGIEEGDIRLAFERHATSKIRTETDLDAVTTLGFRGEALASIAAVSRVTLTTRTRDQDTGLRVKNEGGQITSITEAACAPGTSILVQELFFNVPVRRGFLKKPMTEANTVTELMTRLILSRPDVSFRYVSNGKQIYRSPGDGRTESALLAIFSPSVVRTLRKVEGHENGVLITGFVGIGDNARANRSGEYFFINGRTLRSPLLSGSLEEACRERVMIGKFPICALYLEMPSESININVHPNKMEVRFRFDQRVREAVYELVKDALLDRDAFQRPVEMQLTEDRGNDTLPEVISYASGEGPQLPRSAEVVTGGSVPAIRMGEAAPMPVYRPIEKHIIPEGRIVQAQETLPPPLTRRAAETAERTVSEERKDPAGALQREAFPGSSEAGTRIFTQEETEAMPAPGYKALTPEDSAITQLPGSGASSEKESNPGDAGAVFSARSSGKTAEERTEQISGLPENLPKPMRVFGALFDTFILVEYEDHLLMVDQHAVHERLLFERMMKAYEEQRAGQELLVPYIVPVTKREMAVLEENQDLLESLGLRAEPFSENEVAVRSVPVTLGQSETAGFLRDALDELENGRIPGADKKRASILQMACKHAVKGGEKLTDEMLRSLVEEMIDRKVTPTCPHGRPLVVSISHTELDKKFKRIQT